ncbi:MAG: hypothetical protein D6743_06485 [Calditrichaeota bacterium]|nr:MAG: hypothetical protein D6743_06485 [Calditrichota bacterium]
MRFMMAVLLGGMLAFGSVVLHRNVGPMSGKQKPHPTQAGFGSVTVEGLEILPPALRVLPPTEPDAVSDFRFYVDRFGAVEVFILDRAGKRVRTLVQKYLPSGAYQISWYGEADNGQRLAPGIYVIVVRSEGKSVRKKVALTE